MSEPQGVPQPDPQFIIAAAQEELQASHANRLYLLSLVKQLQGEYANASVQWEAERESLKATIQSLRARVEELEGKPVEVPEAL